ncbi:MAG: hypothetical protein ACQGVC_09220 [Myxococcota bacterium]
MQVHSPDRACGPRVRRLLPLVAACGLASLLAMPSGAACFEADCAVRCQSTGYCVLYFPGAASTPSFIISQRQDALRNISTNLDVVTFKNGSGLEYTADDFTTDTPVFQALAANPGVKFITLCTSSGCNEARRLYSSGILAGRTPLILEADPHQLNSPMPRDLPVNSGPDNWVTFYTGTPDGAFSVGPPGFRGSPPFEVIEVQLNTYPHGRFDPEFDYIEFFTDQHVGSATHGEHTSEQLIYAEVDAPSLLDSYLTWIRTYDVNYDPVTPGGDPGVTAPSIPPGGGSVGGASGGGAGIESRPLWLKELGK